MTTRITFARSLSLSFALLALVLSGFMAAPAAAQDVDVFVLPAGNNVAAAAELATEEKLPWHILPTSFMMQGLEGPLPREDLEALAVRTAISSGGSGSPRPQADEAQQRITARYQDSKMLAYLASANRQQLTQLFYEASNLIDTRHVNPLSYEERTRAAVEGLIRAVENPAYLSANRVNPSSQAVRELQNELANLARTQPARSASEALGIMQWAEQLANRKLGLRPEAVALEFLNGTVDALDRYSAFMPGDSPFHTGSADSAVETAGLEENIVGIGVELKAHERGALVVDVVEGGPAARLGLRSGDVIVAVNQKSVTGMGLGQIADMIGGPAGSSVTLEIERDGQKYRGTARREKVYVSSVSGAKMLDAAQGIGYVRLKQFSASTTADLEKALWGLHRQGMKGLVLDLRGNPGGLLDQAVTLSDLFVPCGTIVTTRGRSSSDNTSETAHFEKTWAVPLVVLVDENSASASEIFAAAVQDNGRGVVVGRRTYGKGTVQTHFPLNSTNGLLKLTTAQFYSPTGREMAGSGVTPDVVVNVQSVGFRGTTEDADVQAALKVLGDGIPAQMAAQSARCQGAPARPKFDNYPTVPAPMPEFIARPGTGAPVTIDPS